MVLICGKMRAGKTTAANFLAQERGFKQFSIATKLKELYVAMTGSGDKNREWLQKTGSALREVFGEDFWVNATVDTIDDYISKTGGSVVVDDVRYPNELQALYSYGIEHFDNVYIIYIDCSLAVQLIRGAEPDSLFHKSEELANQFEQMAAAGFLEGKEDVAFVYSLKNWPYTYTPLIEVVDGELPISQFNACVDEIVSTEARVYQDWYDLDTE